MPKKPSTPAPRPPAGRWERLLNRHPTTFIPHYDAIAPFDYPRPDVDALWAELEHEIDQLASRRAFDEAHPYLVDELVRGRLASWRAIVATHAEERQSILEALREQGVWHRVRLQRRLGSVRRRHWQAVTTQGSTWASLTGLPAEEPLSPQAGPAASETVTPLHRAN